MNASKFGKKTGRSWRLSGVIAVAACLVPWLGLAQPAGAAQIYITNCTDRQVRMCSANDPDAESWRQNLKLPVGETGYFHCKHRCAFVIVECKDDGNCGKCQHAGMPWLDHRWAGGYYRLNALDKTANGNGYQSGNLEPVPDNTTDCP